MCRPLFKVVLLTYCLGSRISSQFGCSYKNLIVVSAWIEDVSKQHQVVVQPQKLMELQEGARSKLFFLLLSLFILFLLHFEVIVVVGSSVQKLHVPSPLPTYEISLCLAECFISCWTMAQRKRSSPSPSRLSIATAAFPSIRDEPGQHHRTSTYSSIYPPIHPSSLPASIQPPVVPLQHLTRI